MSDDSCVHIERGRPNSLMCVSRWGKASAVALVVMGLSGCALFIPEPEAETSYFTKLRGPSGPVRLFVRDEGRGKPIVFLHGFGGSGFSWRFLYPDLSRSYRLISLDLKGFRRSDKPLDDRYSILDHADLVAQFLEKKRLKNVTLVGHSFGGGVALATILKMRARAPRRVNKLVLLDSVAYKQKLPLFIELLQAPVIALVGVTMIPPEIQTTAALKYAFYDDYRITKESILEYARPLYTIGGKYAAVTTARQIIPKNLEAYTRLYPTIKVPALIIWCKHDRVVPLINALRLEAELPRSRLRIISDCGHIPQEESPRETVRLIRKFVK